MSTLSAKRQLDFDFAAGPSASANSLPGQAKAAVSFDRTAGADILNLPRFPTFSYSGSAEIAASRIAARTAAAGTSSAEYNELLETRERLLDKQLAGSLTPQESNQLQYVRWSLDRVDDARYGAGLDKLESVVSQYERFHADIVQFQMELQSFRK